jgi:carboxypeptidase C (cathepsin A)
MKKYLSLALLTFAVLIFAGCGSEIKKEIETPISINECVQICEHANNICTDWMESDDCRIECADWDNAFKECVKNAANCADLENGCAFAIESTQITATKNCDSACKNYVKQCISQVPNATDFLRQDAYNSCDNECAGWNDQKISCLATATDCPSMTEVCGL